MFIFFFFFQAVDVIRVFHVTGVQTCALPILATPEDSLLRLLSSLALRQRPCRLRDWVFTHSNRTLGARPFRIWTAISLPVHCAPTDRPGLPEKTAGVGSLRYRPDGISRKRSLCREAVPI